MHIFEQNIKNLNIDIPDISPPLANYVSYKISDKLIFLAGQGPIKNGSVMYKGKVGVDITEVEGIKAAELCCINIIANLKSALNSEWEKIDHFVKLGGFVNCKSDFTNHPQIINGASDLLVKIFGEKGKHARFAVGSNSLPMDIAVEIDAIVKII
tara:strand:- start:954 stop:1418 length:465 start_codon:yes stop_codon:yes gene_type:complete